MSNLPHNLPALLRRAGLKVVEIQGWEYRGRPGLFAPVGPLNHHTGASAALWTMDEELDYAQWMFLKGRSDLPAPLCQIALGRSGTIYIGAAGRANHAGAARASGSVSAGDGNNLYVGIEWMLSGTEKIPAHMMKAGVTLNAVLTARVTKTSVQSISCHFDTSVTGKWDIGDPDGVDFKGHKVLDVPKFRLAVHDARMRLYPDKKEPAEMKPLALSWNMKVGRHPENARNELKALLKANRNPPVVALQEGIGYRSTIAAVAAAHNYRVFQPRNAKIRPPFVQAREGGSTVLLIRKGRKVRESGVIRCKRTWSGPVHGLRREGRVLPWVVVKVNKKWTLVVSVHMPTDRLGKNSAAWKETIKKIERLATDKGLPYILLGDWNSGHGAVSPTSPRALAERTGGHVVHGKPNLDYALVKGHALTLVKGAKRGSDHHAIKLNRK